MLPGLPLREQFRVSQEGGLMTSAPFTWSIKQKHTLEIYRVYQAEMLPLLPVPCCSQDHQPRTFNLWTSMTPKQQQSKNKN